MKKLLILLLISIFVLPGCSEGVDTKMNSTVQEGVHNNTDEVSDESLIDYIQDIEKVLSEKDVVGLKSLIGGNGVYYISIFDDKRDVSRAIYTNEEDLSDDFILKSSDSKSGGYYLRTFFNFAPLENTKILSSDELSDFSFDFDWRIQDESKLQSEILILKDELRKLILVNNEYVPQVFSLDNGIYAFSYSDLHTYSKEEFEKLGLGKAYSPEAPLESFTGIWIIFERIEDSFFIRSFIEIQ